jgi:hypothetical protein
VSEAHPDADEPEPEMAGMAPTRVQVAIVTLQALRSPAHMVAGAEPGEQERMAINAACQVLTLYMLGENDYREEGGRGRIVRKPRPSGGPGPTPAGVPS